MIKDSQSQEQRAIFEQMQAVDKTTGAWRDEDYSELCDDNAINAWLGNRV